jgi:hypothetical protein
MRATLRRIHSPDVYDLRSWVPDEGPMAVLLQLMVGAADGSAGEDTFDLTLCNAEWLAERVRVDGILDGRHHLIVAEYDYELIERYLQRRVGACEGSTWQEVALRVSRLGAWEFEDYTE